MTPEEFREIIYKDKNIPDKNTGCPEENNYGIYPPPTDAQTALNVLIKHFLGEDWYVALPMGVEQVNTEAVFAILLTHPEKKKLRLFERIKNAFK